MLLIEKHHVDRVRQASQPADLWDSVQAAIELEHATIPPYLTALFSIKQGANLEASGIIGSVLRQEMLHMAIAANLLNALNGEPKIDDPDFLPTYPGSLPMGVRSNLVIGLEKVSKDVVESVFMAIEEPEHSIAIERLEATDNPTIGEFYGAIAEKLEELAAKGVDPIVGRPERQVCDPRWYPRDQLFPILTVEDAVKAISIIVEQGEGTSKSPLEGAGGGFAHYYRFGEIANGRKIVPASTKSGWAYAGDPVPLTEDGVWNLAPNKKARDYAPGSRARVLLDMFNAAYTNLLRCLDRTFNGGPGQLGMAISVMVEMQIAGQKLVTVPIDGTDQFAAPTFEYTP